jgi:hypothetical protein
MEIGPQNNAPGPAGKRKKNHGSGFRYSTCKVLIIFLSSFLKKSPGSESKGSNNIFPVFLGFPFFPLLGGGDSGRR